LTLSVDHSTETVRPIRGDEVRRLLSDNTELSARALLEDYGVIANLGPLPRVLLGMRPDQFALVAFRGKGITGTLGIGASLQSLRRSFRCEGREHDWLAELGNQLFGRIKNEMLRLGFALQPGLPRLVDGNQLPFFDRDAAEMWHLNTGDGVVSIGLIADVPFPVVPDMELLNWDVPLEGEVLLF
jgi:hypothetical protein